MRQKCNFLLLMEPVRGGPLVRTLHMTLSLSTSSTTRPSSGLQKPTSFPAHRLQPARTPDIMRATMRLTYSFLFVMLTASAWAQTPPLTTEVETVYPDARALYLDLHQNPELSSHETQTAAKLAGRLRDLGYTVTEHVGGTGVVAILKNGAGPTVMLRTELDGLPVEEKTGLRLCQQGPHQRRFRTRCRRHARLRT